MTLFNINNVSSFQGYSVTKGEIDDHSAYDDFLNECYEEVKVAGLSFLPSRVLEELDPVAYSCGYSDWMDSIQCELEEAIENEDYDNIEWIEEPEEIEE